jgi:hypothetical protein
MPLSPTQRKDKVLAGGFFFTPGVCAKARRDRDFEPMRERDPHMMAPFERDAPLGDRVQAVDIRGGWMALPCQ